MEGNYVRLYTDSSGNSRFADVSAYIAGGSGPEGSLYFREFDGISNAFWSGTPAAWSRNELHTAPRKQLLVVVRGGFEVTTSTGERRDFSPGSVVLIEDTQGRGHATRMPETDGCTVLGIALDDYL
jgi:uncharacterized cupin superfamily protein